MVVDRLSELGKYLSLNPRFDQARVFLQEAFRQPQLLSDGRHVLQEGKLWVIVESGEGRGPEGAPLEAHRQMIDIQLVLAGVEQIGWRPQSECHQITDPYQAERDIEFYADPPRIWLPLQPGDFAIFFPSDAHAPLAGTGRVRKAIVKVAVDP
jgi:biofilm protein TabA